MTDANNILTFNNDNRRIDVFKPGRILFRTVFLSWAVVISTTGIFILSIIPYQREQLLEEINTRARVAYTSVAQVMLTSILLEDYSSVVDHCLTVIKGNPSILYIIITRSDGFSLIHTKESWSQKQLGKEWMPDLDIYPETGHILTSSLFKKKVFHRSFAFSYSGINWGWIHVGLSTENLSKDLNSLYLRVFITALFAISVGFFASYFFARRLSSPILLLDKVTRQVAEGDLSVRVDIKTGDEIENLANSFNDMTTSLLNSKIELEETNKKLMETARNVGMTEVATGILHNVGNVLNSIGVTTSSLTRRIKNMETDILHKLADQLDENKNDLASFLSKDGKHLKLISLLSGLADHLNTEQEKHLRDLDQLKKHVQHITEIINLQQSYGKTFGMVRQVSVSDLIEDAVKIELESLSKHQIKLVKHIESFPPLLLDRQKVLQILVNLISNAKDALTTCEKKSKKISIAVKRNRHERLHIEVSDNGVGITKENLDRIFNYGFTTKKTGHGFGLHSGALNAREMGGSLTVNSEGPGTGATFILELPCKSGVDSNG